jgi:hypothetical protein
MLKHVYRFLCTRKALAQRKSQLTRVKSHVSSCSPCLCPGHNFKSSLLTSILFSKTFKKSIFTQFSDPRTIPSYAASHGTRKTTTRSIVLFASQGYINLALKYEIGGFDIKLLLYLKSSTNSFIHQLQ